VPLAGQPELQERLVWLMIGTVSVVTICVVGLIVHLTRRSPGLLFNPQDIDRAVHLGLYGPQVHVPPQEVMPPTQPIVEFEVSSLESRDPTR